MAEKTVKLTIFEKKMENFSKKCLKILILSVYYNIKINFYFRSASMSDFSNITPYKTRKTLIEQCKVDDPAAWEAFAE